MDITKPTKPYVVDGGGLYVATPMKLDRNRRIVEMYAAGMRKGDIAAEFGITRPRVHQIIQRMQRLKALLEAR